MISTPEKDIKDNLHGDEDLKKQLERVTKYRKALELLFKDENVSSTLGAFFTAVGGRLENVARSLKDTKTPKITTPRNTAIVRLVAEALRRVYGILRRREGAQHVETVTSRISREAKVASKSGKKLVEFRNASVDAINAVAAEVHNEEDNARELAGEEKKKKEKKKKGNRKKNIKKKRRGQEKEN